MPAQEVVVARLRSLPYFCRYPLLVSSIQPAGICYLREVSLPSSCLLDVFCPAHFAIPAVAARPLQVGSVSV